MGYFSPAGAGGITSSTVITASGTVRNVFASLSAVASGASPTILTYTVPAGKTGYLLAADFSGQNIATYDLMVNATEFARFRTYFGGDLTASIRVGSSVQDAYQMVAGTVVTIQVHNFRPTSADFEARLQVIEA